MSWPNCSSAQYFLGELPDHLWNLLAHKVTLRLILCDMRDTDPIDVDDTDGDRVLPRFGLKWMFCLIAAIGIGSAWLVQPQVVCSVVVDFTELEEKSQQALALARTQGLVLCPIGGTNAERHYIRVRTPRVILDALEASPKLRSFAESKAQKQPLKWIYENTEAVPVSDHQIRVTVFGDASEEKELQHLIETLATAYVDYLDSSYKKTLSAVWADPTKPTGTITKEPSGWRVRWNFGR